MEATSPQFLSEFFEISSDLFVITDLSGKIIHTNSAWGKCLGWRKEELVGRPFLHFVHEEDRSRTIKASKELMGGIHFDNFENRYTHKDGTFRWISWTTGVSKNGQIGFGAGKDITEYKQANLEFQELLIKLQLVTDHIKDVIWMTDLSKNKMVFISKGYERVWERTCESLFENPLSFIEAIHEEDREGVIKAFVKQSQGEYKETYRVVTKSGTKWIFDRAFPIFNEKGEPYLVVGIASDITEQKRTQELIEIERARTLQASKLATLGEMAGGVAHEINNPLAVIMGKCQQLNRKMDIDLVSDFTFIKNGIDKIEKNASRIEKIVKGLRLFSREGSSDAFEKFHLKGAIEDTLELCYERFSHHEVELTVNIESDPIVNGRAVQISQVLLNLLNNSYDAIYQKPKRWINIQIKIKDRAVELSVTDSGQGIPTAVAERIMEPFFTTKEIGKGTGLGLSISKGIIETHGGELYLDQSSPQTRFVVRLPISQ